MDWVAWLGRFKTTPLWAVLIGLVNLVGIAYGFYYYLPQFAATPWWLWPFVPDSPLAVLWAELALVAWWLRRRRAGAAGGGSAAPALDALAFVGNVQVGLWTVYVLVAYADSFGTYTLNLNTVLLAAHAGMALLALVFLQGMREERRRAPRRMAWGVGVAALYYLVNDALDYLGPTFPVAAGRGPRHECLDYGMRPYTVPCHEGAETALALVTLALTLASVAALWWLSRPSAGRRRPAPDERA